MNFLKRATTSIFRQPGKFIVLLLLIFILSTVISGAISTVAAIGNTGANLRRQMRPIVILELDHDMVEAAWEEAGGYWHTVEIEQGVSSEMRGADWPSVMPLTSEMVRQIADLPQVEYYHYAITSFLDTQLIEYLPDGAEPTAGGSWCIWDEENNVCFEELTLHDLNQKVLRGTSDYEPLEMREGLIELSSGNNFENYEQHQSTSAYPVLVSEGFARTNDFSIGSTFTLWIRIIRMDEIDWSVTEVSWENALFDQRYYEFEIIGLFDVLPLETDDEWVEAGRQRELANRIFTVNAAPAAMQLFEMEGQIAAAEEAGEELWFDPDDWDFQIETSIMLIDPLELESFTIAVEDYLPEFWFVNDLNGSFDQISASMQALNRIADGILLVAVGATILILSLLITLFLRDRRHEIGIYLALGEQKSKIISQILVEVLATALIGITFAIFVGNAVSAYMSHEMIRTELSQPTPQEPWERSQWIDGMADLGFGSNLSPEEMLEAFDTSLNVSAVVLLYVVGLGTVAVSTLIPIVYVVKLKPKKVLL